MTEEEAMLRSVRILNTKESIPLNLSLSRNEIVKNIATLLNCHGKCWGDPVLSCSKCTLYVDYHCLLYLREDVDVIRENIYEIAKRIAIQEGIEGWEIVNELI